MRREGFVIMVYGRNKMNAYPPTLQKTFMASRKPQPSDDRSKLIDPRCLLSFRNQ